MMDILVYKSEFLSGQKFILIRAKDTPVQNCSPTYTEFFHGMSQGITHTNLEMCESHCIYLQISLTLIVNDFTKMHKQAN